MAGETDGDSVGSGMNDGSDSNFGGSLSDFGGQGVGFSMDPGLQSLDLSSLLGIVNDDGPMSMDSGQQGLNLGSLFAENQSLVDSLPKGLKGIIATILEKADKSGVAGAVLGKAGMMANPDQGKAWGGAAAATAAALAGLGPVAAAVAAWGGGQLGQGAFSGLTAPGDAAESAASSMNSPGGWQDMLQGLGGMYAGYRGSKDSGNMLGSLQSLYSQDSPYAQAMRQQLQRRDAAGGRRSQYGPREVELQARLAQMASGQIPAMAQLQRQQQIARNSMLQQGLGLFDKMGGLNGLQQLFQGGGGGNMFGGGISMPSGGDSGTNWLGGGIDQGFDANNIDWGFGG